MPNKTIYVSDEDLPVFDQAAELAGGLSPAIATALREFITKQNHHNAGFEEIALRTHIDGVSSTKVFYGRRLAQIKESTEGHTVTWSSYVTPKDNLVVIKRDTPDMGPFTSSWMTSARDFTDNMQSWISPRGPRPPFGPGTLIPNRHRHQPGATVDADEDHDPTSQTTDRRNTANHRQSFTPFGDPSFNPFRDIPGKLSEFFANFEPEPANPLRAMEVFESLDSLRNAAFRNDDAKVSESQVGVIPPRLAAATERALNTDDIEYLDI